VSALDRFDAWADDLDETLTSAADPELSDLYDPVTVSAIDGRTGEPSETRRAPRWRGGAAAGAMAVGVMQGLRDVVDDGSDPIVEIDQDQCDHRRQAVTVHLVPGDPAAGVAVIRRWLL
jgi:hypothetical protein